jgi:hypothetical protein
VAFSFDELSAVGCQFSVGSLWSLDVVGRLQAELVGRIKREQIAHFVRDDKPDEAFGRTMQNHE